MSSSLSRRCRCLLALLLMSLAGPAVAQDDADRELARHRFATGQLLYQRGRYDEALVEFEAAQATLRRPEFDYNIGRCLQKLGRNAEAAAALERYMKAKPDDPDAGSIWQTIAELRLAALESKPPQSPPPATEKPPTATRVTPPPSTPPPTIAPQSTAPPPTTREPAPTPPATEPPPVSPKAEPPLAGTPPPVQPSPRPLGLLDSGPGKAGVALVTVGALAIVVGAATGIVALLQRGDYDQKCDAMQCDKNQSIYDGAHTLANVTDGLLVGGVVAGVVGAVLMAARPKVEARTALRLSPSAGGLAVAF